MFDPESLFVSLNRDLCLSGGAKGADAQWGMTAGCSGHMVIHWSFAGHKPYAPDSEVVRLSDEQLKVADPSIVRANQTLKRRVPYDKTWLMNLIRRNYYQIKWSQSVYAVGFLRNGNVDGGTAWATQMYMDRFLKDNEDISQCKLYLFDQLSRTWYFWNNDWSKMDGQPPKPSGIWAGIGTRDLNDDGKNAIRKLMNWVKPEA